jgi:hypothetical protein
VVGKNYRLQDIQLLKITSASAVGLRAGQLVHVRDVEPASCSRAFLTKIRAIEVMENTGLEPVTSWLQTRRSPS